MTCLHCFLEAPRLQVRYSCGARQVVQELTLPLAPHKFMLPEPHIAKEAFFDKWKSYQGGTWAAGLMASVVFIVMQPYCYANCLWRPCVAVMWGSGQLAVFEFMGAPLSPAVSAHSVELAAVCCGLHASLQVRP